MARSTSQPQTQTQLAQERGPTGNIQHDGPSQSSVSGTVAVVVGVPAVIVGIIPKLGVGALILAAVALAAGIPSLRHGRASPGFSRARLGVVLAVVAVIIGVLNIGIQLDWFDFFNPDS